jgi:hypothetical protein
MKKGLNPYEQWMVRSNLEHIKTNNLNADSVIAQLRFNGYPQIANAVAEAINQEPSAAADLQQRHFDEAYQLGRKHEAELRDELRAFVEQVADSWRDEIDNDDEINGGDCVDWAVELVEEARALIKARGRAGQ